MHRSAFSVSMPRKALNETCVSETSAGDSAFIALPAEIQTVYSGRCNLYMDSIVRVSSILASSLAPVLIGSTALVSASSAAVGQSTPSKVQPAPTKAVSQEPAALLPAAFAGWMAAEAPKTLTDPAQADPAHAAALKEYEFTGGALARYQRDGEKLNLRGLRFHDASGAYGAYSFYRQNGWPKEKIGAGAASDRNRVIFWVGNTVVDATFSRISPMSGSELREMAGQLPCPDGSRALAPPILANLPQSWLDGQSTHYAVGPAGYAGAGGVLPAELVGFDFGAESVTANYTLRTGSATLTVIDYPTPQMAAVQEAKIRAYIQAGKQAQPPWPKPLQDSGLESVALRRSGPLVALVCGNAFAGDSRKLLSLVNYEADLTSIPQPTESEIAKTGKLLFGIAMLVLVAVGAALVLGVALGSGRALYRIARGKPASSVYDEEFTSLNLRD